MVDHKDLKLGYACNNNCIHCVIADQRQHAMSVRGNTNLSTFEYKKELISAFNDGFRAVTFTGGEPTLRKDILELIAFAKELKFHVNMQTNGRRFFYDAFCDEISKFGVSYTIALHGSTSDVHDSITRIHGSFKQTCDGIKNLVSKNQYVHGKIVISTYNMKYLKDIALLFYELGAKGVNIAFPHAEGNAWTYFDKIVPTYTTVAPYVHDAIDAIKELNDAHDTEFIIDTETMPYCFMQGYEEYIAENRYLHASEKKTLKQVGFEECDWNVVRKEIKSKFPQCKKCKWNDVCEGPWKEYQTKYGSDEFKPIE